MTATFGFRANDTHNVDSLFKSLYYLQRTPDCEDASQIISERLHKELMKFPEKKLKGYSCRAVDRYEYFDNGVVRIINNDKYFVVIEGYTPQLIVKPKKVKKRVSYDFIKRFNPIWYAQIMKYLKRSYKPSKYDPYNYQELLRQWDIYESLDKNSKSNIDFYKIRGNLDSQARKIHRLFDFDFVYLYRPKRYMNIDLIKNTPFFFLTDIECKAIINTIQSDKYDEVDRKANISKIINNLFIKSNKDRQYIPSINLNNFEYEEERKHDEFFITSITRVQHDKFWNFYLKEFENLNNKNKSILKTYGIDIPLSKESEDEE